MYQFEITNPSKTLFFFSAEVHPNQLNNNVTGPKHSKIVAGAQKLFSITSSYPK